MSLAQIQPAIVGMPAPPSPAKPATPADAEPPVAPEPDVSHLQKAIFGLVHTQMSAQQGIKKHGKAAWDALKKEMQQFRDMAVLEALDPFTMDDDEKTGALRALSVIKEKRSGVLKGRVCADGRPQQGLYSKAETGSSTISTDALFMTIMIHTLEGRDVATADIAGAYLHAHMKCFVCLRFTGWVIDLLLEVYPEWEHLVCFDERSKHKTKCLYV
jgi:hypothetical protein